MKPNKHINDIDTNGLSVHVKFPESIVNDTSVSNLIAYGSYATAVNSYVADNSMAFLGDGYFTVSVPETLFRANFTINMWAKMTDGQPADSPNFFGRSETGAQNIYSYVLANGGIGLNFRSGGANTLQVVSSAGTLPNNQTQWFMVTFTVEQSDASNSVAKLYLNGALNKTGNTTAFVMDDYRSAIDMCVGACTYTGGSRGSYFTGSIGELLIFNRLLSVEDVSSLYNQTTRRYNA